MRGWLSIRCYPVRIDSEHFLETVPSPIGLPALRLLLGQKHLVDLRLRENPGARLVFHLVHRFLATESAASLTNSAFNSVSSMIAAGAFGFHGKIDTVCLGSAL
jgi:hypothetical protein